MTSSAKSPDPRTPSPTIRRTLVALGVLVLGAGLLAACGPSDPIEDIEERRSRYSAELASFSVVQTPAPEAAAEPMAAEGEDGAAAADEAAGDEAGAAAEAETDEADEAAEAEPVEVAQDVLLDILLRFDGHDPLPGVTIDITHADADEREKGVHRAYIDTTDVHRGPPAQVVHRLEDVPFEEGDRFHVEVRTPVPAGERDEYQEFSESGEGV